MPRPAPVITATRSSSAPTGKTYAMAAGVRIKRIYDDPARDDGYRMLVDRVWARGVSR